MDTDSLHTQLTPTVPCTQCGQVEVPAPANIEEDPICPDCREGNLCDRLSHRDFMQVARED